MKKKYFIILSILFSFIPIALFSQRFPQPEFESGHVPPATQTPLPRLLIFEYIDVFVLFLLIAIISYFIIKKRSRKGIFYTSIFSLIYFGFYKQGCVCSVGSIQNIVLALADKSYAIPITVIFFFSIPLIFTLFFGRVFCSGVCFMGAMQELLIFKLLKIPSWLSKSLQVIPYIYLSLAILLAITGSDFIICRYDPFIGFFRLGATINIFIFGILILLTGLFVARPYCRFLCPYGVILNWISKISIWHLSISPGKCINCKLCENSCPVDAIEKPTNDVNPEKKSVGIKRLMVLFLFLPFFVFIGGFIGYSVHKPLSMVNSEVKLAEEIAWEIKNNKKSLSQEAITFNSSGEIADELFKKANVIRKNFKIYSIFIGCFLGFIFGISLIKLSVFKNKKNYEPDRGNCFSCGRCFKYCPVEKKK